MSEDEKIAEVNAAMAELARCIHKYEAAKDTPHQQMLGYWKVIMLDSSMDLTRSLAKLQKLRAKCRGAKFERTK
jgi:hypothetical protein